MCGYLRKQEGFFMLTHLFLFITSLGIFCAAHCNDLQPDSQTLLRLNALASVLENQDCGELDLSQERVYVNPLKMRATSHGMVLCSENDEEILIPELLSDYNGCFVRCTEDDLKMVAKNNNIGFWCNSCSAFRAMDKYGRCVRCGNKL